MATLTYRSAAKIAAREMRSSSGKFFFVILSVAIGVAALTGVRGFSSSFRATLLNRARSIMAADLSARMFMQPTPEQQKGLEAIQREGVEITPVTELLSMASAPKTLDPLLVSLKAVDPALYPFYVEVELAPAAPLKAVLTSDSAAVADDLLVRLRLKGGDQLKIGTQLFRIAAVVVNEPDRLSGNFAAGPRVLISREGLDASGLLAPGSHAGQRYLFKVPKPSNGAPISDKAVADLKARLEKLLPESQVIDYRETNPALTQGLDRATGLLSLMSLVALVLGAIGVAMAMRAHLQQRLDTIAIMKSLGARSGQIIKIYLLQTLLLGLLGGLLGVSLGVGVQLAFPVLLAKLIHIDTALHIQTRTILTGLAAGILTTLLFTLPPLLDIRNIRPILILRRAMDEEETSLASLLFRRAWRYRYYLVGYVVVAAAFAYARIHSARTPVFAIVLPLVLGFLAFLLAFVLLNREVRQRIFRRPAQVAAFAIILVGLAVIATTLSDSAEVGQVFSFGLVAVLAVLLGASTGVLAALRFFLTRPRLLLPSSLRHGLANLYRPGNPSAALLAALGMGVMQIMTVYLVQQAVVTELHMSAAPDLPNVFLVDITNDEIDGMRAFLHAQPNLRRDPELLPVVSSRILFIDGVSATQLKLKNFPKRMLQPIRLSWSDAPPPGTPITQGRWWGVGEKTAQVAVAQRQAERLGVKVGSTITFA